MRSPGHEVLIAAIAAVLASAACGSDQETPARAMGGSSGRVGNGGASLGGSTGGAALGGAQATSGGTPTFGGAMQSGGTTTTGGQSSTGGASSGGRATGGVSTGGGATGGTNSGGSVPLGGRISSGGVSVGGSSGGSSATGGSQGMSGGSPATGGAGTGGQLTGGAPQTGGTGTTGGMGTTGGTSTGGRAAGGTATGGTATGGAASGGAATGGAATGGGASGGNAGGQGTTPCHEPATVSPLPADFGAVPHATKGAIACGVWVISNDVVADAAVLRAQAIIQVELAKVSQDMPDVPAKLTASKSRIVIVGKNEDQSDYWPNQSGRRSWCAWPDRNGMIETTTVEEELTSGQRSQLMTTVHEMGHFTQFVLYLYSKGLYDQSVQAFNNCNQSLYNSYDLQNEAEFFAGDTLRWFDLNPSDLAVSDANSLTQREQLQKYSTTMYTIMGQVFTTNAIP